MKRFFLYVPIVLSLLVLGAHFLRYGNTIVVISIVALMGLLFVPRWWVARLMQVVFALGAGAGLEQPFGAAKLGLRLGLARDCLGQGGPGLPQRRLLLDVGEADDRLARLDGNPDLLASIYDATFAEATVPSALSGKDLTDNTQVSDSELLDLLGID